MRMLHVLNGDATREVFEKSGISGEVAVWREMLCEGRTPDTDEIPRFFTERAAYLQEEYGIDAKTYLHSIRQDAALLLHPEQYNEIVLWFEFDLFCQVNLIFLMSYLRQQPAPLPKVTIVQLDEHPEVPNFRGLGMLQPQHFPPLFEKREELSDDDWAFATETWHAYRKGDVQALELLSGRKSSHMPYLGRALQAHLQRLPALGNGLNVIERFFLDRLALGKLPDRDLYYQFWNDFKIYGFGDFQLDHYVQQLQRAGVIEKEGDRLVLTSLGREVLENEENYQAFANLQTQYLGGLPLEHTPWRWDTEEGIVARAF
ncbi:hypothetical protein ACWKWU_11250 [Chitinophaga lutea]